MGLVPNSVQGLAYLITFGKTCNLSQDSGALSNSASSLVWSDPSGRQVQEHDEFSVQQGSSWRLIHNIDITRDRGDVVAYYAVAELRRIHRLPR